MSVDALPGLDLLRRHVADPARRASIFATMGMDATGADAVIERGHVVLGARADARHLNPMGGVHGGFAATVLDSVTGMAVHTMLDAGSAFATIDLAVKMLRPIPQDGDLVAEGRVTSMTRSLGVAEGTIRDRDGRLLASGSATCFLKHPSPDRLRDGGRRD